MSRLKELKNKRILLGVTGGIAAYKACDLASMLVKNEANVQVVMTDSAKEFISPLTFSAITGNPVVSQLFESDIHIPHIQLVEECDIFAIVPATANIIGKYASGIADDLLSTLLIAAKCPIFFAPAMNVNMYNNPTVQENLKKIKSVGAYVIEPDEGHLACGTKGKGRLPETDRLYKYILEILFKNKKFSGLNVLITAGGTRESVDPVRFIGNKSSGKMGYALADVALKNGANVTLISTLDKEIAVNKFIKVESAQEMYEKVMENYIKQDIIIMAAAVADYTPTKTNIKKIKKDDDSFVLELKKTPDILAYLGIKKDKQMLIGFAAETENLEKFALEKLVKKNLDFIVANDVSVPEYVFGSDYNQVSVYNKEGLVFKTERLKKHEISSILWDLFFENIKLRKQKKKGREV